ncbi:MAG: HD domain-containing protein [Sphingorhabdus sp.]
MQLTALQSSEIAGPGLLAFIGLFEEIGHLKRIHSANHHGSLATRLFAEGWARIAAGQNATEVALVITAKAVAAARLGDIDTACLRKAGLSQDEAVAILRAAIEEMAGPIDPALTIQLVEAVCDDGPQDRQPPTFAEKLARQPRAGVTCPGRARIMLEPPENHAEHSIIVGIYAVLLSPHYGADAGAAMLMALAHHLHNADMPDSGFTGEMLLGAHLGPIMDRFTEQALDELPPDIRPSVEAARDKLSGAETAEGKAFHAADVIDRVLQIQSHLAAATLTMDRVLGEMELVHDGPVKAFHDRVLVEAGLS